MRDTPGKPSLTRAFGAASPASGRGERQQIERQRMKLQTIASDIETRRAAARRTAMILGGIALFLFALSIIEVALQK